jgi:hypothetical protein
VKGPVRLQVYDPEDIARRTVRETIDPMDTALNLSGGKKRVRVYPDDKPLPTIKETTIDNDRDGNIGTLEGMHGAYKSTEYDAKLTQKQFVSDHDYFGTAGQNRADGYKVAPAEAPDTQKQFLSDHDYFGTAMAGQDKKPTSIEDIMNARINELKESTLEGRDPTKESVKVASGADDVSMTFKKIECDDLAAREIHNIGRVVNKRENLNDCGFTKQKDQLNNDDRLDINLLAALKENPYALSITGAA